ncbi:GntR family transcriptional regulator [Gulosibacter faecalis]|jgi:DNA-binding GntR family transcriptional regulator|uniref:GntR family transcriptional regulator n=1 Tax=Gulosibacter faecalis TaxID=272240 RepID=A0ABW5UYG5_9MICO|nr:GntR family transcriptional regulator [Gulosibacter faecalis]
MTETPPPHADAVVHGKSGEQVTEWLRRDILEGVFVPGARIRQTDLAERYGATRAPVREALRMLAATGLISHVANAGARVARLTADECAELYRVRERIEPLLLEYTVPLLTPDDVAELRRLANEMSHTDDPELFVQLDREFHDLTYRPNATILLAQTVRDLWDRTQHYRREFSRKVRSFGDQSADFDHQLIVNAIERGDTDEVGRLIELHIRRTRLSLVAHPEVFA